MTNTYKTLNPLGSNNARDLSDNASNFDEYMNSDLPSIKDRFDKRRETLAGNQVAFDDAQKGRAQEFTEAQAERESEFNTDQSERDTAFQTFLDGTGWSSIGAYGSGVVITSHSQTVDYLGQPYALKPSIPASITTPYVTTGAWATEGAKFKLVGDNSLRQELSSPIGSSVIGHTDGGIPMTVAKRLTETPASASDQKQAMMMKPFFGFNNGTTDTNLFPGASNAFQGISILNEGGVDYAYVAIRVSGGSWTTAERCRICRFRFDENGGNYDSIIYTKPLAIGHGADISARIEGGKVFIYTSSAVTDAAQQGTNAGKGYAKITWKGAATAQSDVVSYLVFGLEGSGHRFSEWNRATVALSDDRRWMILATTPLRMAVGRTLAVFDFAKLEAMPDKTLANPDYVFTLSEFTSQGGNVVQGMCSDGHTIKILFGGTDVFGQNFVMEYSLDGNLRRKIPVDGPAARHGSNGLLNNPLGFPWRIEPEGICNYRGGSVVTFAEGWYASAKVVTHRGRNWAGISPASFVNTPPSNRSYFSRTDKDATDGEWLPTGNYTNTSNLSDATKTLYYVGPSLGLSQEQGSSNGILDRPDPSQLVGGQGSGATSLGFQFRGTFPVREYAEAYGEYIERAELDTGSRFKLYDSRVGYDNTPYVSIQANFAPDMRAMVIRGSGTSPLTSAWLRLHAQDCPLYPGAYVLGTGPSGSIRMVLDQYGTAQFNSSAGYSPLISDRNDSGDNLTFKRVGVEIGSISQNTTSLTFNGRPGIGLRFATSTSGAAINRWEITADGTLRPMANGEFSFGQAGLKASELFATTGVINTCDARHKTELLSLKDAELAVGRRLVREIGVWQWLSEVEIKGEDVARWHLSPTVQKAIEIFEEEGLDPLRYGMICHDKWDAEYETVDAVLELIAPDDESGEEQYREVAPAYQKLVREAGDLYSFREGQTHALMLAAMAADRDADKLENDQRFSEMKSRIEALEKLNS